MSSAIVRVPKKREIIINQLLDFLSGKATQGKILNQLNNSPFLPETAQRFAGSNIGQGIVRALPATASSLAFLGAGDVLLGGETFANDGMDLLGMGAGAYGMRRGAVGGTTPAGRALQYTTGAVLGKLGIDLVQASAGGGNN